MKYFQGIIDCPAKLNLSLRVARKLRPDGFHEIDSVFQAIDFSDKLQLTAAPGTGSTLEIKYSPEFFAGHSELHSQIARQEQVKQDENLVLLATRAWTDKFLNSGEQFSFQWMLIKSIPTGAGLGGGSSDAAASLKLLTAMADHFKLLPASYLNSAAYREALLEIAANLGSDIPFFLGASTAARIRGRGEIILPRASNRQKYILALSQNFTATAKAYARLDAKRAALKGNKEEIYSNDFSLLYEDEQHRFARLLADFPDANLGLSGSGSTFFFSDVIDEETFASIARVEGYLLIRAQAIENWPPINLIN
ncbi:MAG: hypothetical protein Q4P65_00890 [Eubacteriales bacterium]|nr:hypothetical protein [Eubacteriales bacterium]